MGSLLIHSVAGLENVGRMVEWSAQEQAQLEWGLLQYGRKPNVEKYVLIAKELKMKTVRDVASRALWTMESRKECKAEKDVETAKAAKISSHL